MSLQPPERPTRKDQISSLSISTFFYYTKKSLYWVPHSSRTFGCHHRQNNFLRSTRPVQPHPLAKNSSTFDHEELIPLILTTTYSSSSSILFLYWRVAVDFYVVADHKVKRNTKSSFRTKKRRIYRRGTKHHTCGLNTFPSHYIGQHPVPPATVT